MPRYIDIEPYDSCLIVANSEDSGIKCKDIPTADVQEVKHGKWIVEERNNIGYTHKASIDEFGNPFVKKVHYTDLVYRCNECLKINHEGATYYCPNCGARMDGDAE